MLVRVRGEGVEQLQFHGGRGGFRRGGSLFPGEGKYPIEGNQQGVVEGREYRLVGLDQEEEGSNQRSVIKSRRTVIRRRGQSFVGD